MLSWRNMVDGFGILCKSQTSAPLRPQLLNLFSQLNRERSELVYTPAILAIGETFATGPVSHLNTSTRVSVSRDLVQLFWQTFDIRATNFWPQSTKEIAKTMCWPWEDLGLKIIQGYPIQSSCLNSTFKTTMTWTTEKLHRHSRDSTLLQLSPSACARYCVCEMRKSS